jgi:hypothetical protein
MENYSRAEMEKMNKDFPSLKQAKEYLDILENMQLEKFSITDIETIIDNYFPIIPYHENQIDSGKDLYRTVICGTPMPHKSVDRIKYPPMHVLLKKNEYGRANRPEQQVFYCSENLLISTMEVCQNLKKVPEIKDRKGFATVGIWETVNPLKVLYVCHSSKSNLIREDLRASNYNFQNILKKNDVPQETIEVNRLIQQFFANQFANNYIKSHHYYKFSVYYFSLVEKMLNIINVSQHGLIYPSVPMKYIGDNYCLTKSTYDDKYNLKIKKALFIYFYNVDFERGEFEYDVLDESDEIFGTQIYWRNKKYN